MFRSSAYSSVTTKRQAFYHIIGQPCTIVASEIIRAYGSRTSDGVALRPVWRYAKNMATTYMRAAKTSGRLPWKFR